MSFKHWGGGSVYRRGKRWWISYSINGKQFQESSKSEKKSDAEKLLRQKVGGGTNGPSGKAVYVGELLDLVLYDYKANGKDLEWATTLIEKHLRPFFKNFQAARVGTAEITQYQERRRNLGRKNATINHEMALLRRAFKLGMDAEPPLVNRCPKIKKLAENNVRQGFFTEDEYLAMREALPDYLRPMLAYAFFTGCRRGEIVSLKWDQVDLKAGMVRLEPGTTKNKQARAIPLTDELIEMLTAMKQQREELWPDCPWVFSRRGFKILNFRNAWDAACKKTGVKRLFHDLRRSGIRNLIQSGTPEKTAMAISGHKTRSVFDRYQIVREEDLKEAARKVGRKK